MPGPKSFPQARDKNGHYVRGKTAVQRAGLRAGEGIRDQKEYIAPPKPKGEKRDA